MKFAFLKGKFLLKLIYDIYSSFLFSVPFMNQCVDYFIVQYFRVFKIPVHKIRYLCKSQMFTMLKSTNEVDLFLISAIPTVIIAT